MYRCSFIRSLAGIEDLAFHMNVASAECSVVLLLLHFIVTTLKSKDEKD